MGRLVEHVVQKVLGQRFDPHIHMQTNHNQEVEALFDVVHSLFEQPAALLRNLTLEYSTNVLFS